MTDYSRFIIREKYKNKFFDFRNEECRIRVFTYSIYLKKPEELFNLNNNENYFDKLFNNLNNTKTLVSRASAVLLQSYENNKSNAAILLETKLSPFRQNYDYYHWRTYLN
jgi:hypothetical protein